LNVSHEYAYSCTKIEILGDFDPLNYISEDGNGCKNTSFNPLNIKIGQMVFSDIVISAIFKMATVRHLEFMEREFEPAARGT